MRCASHKCCFNHLVLALLSAYKARAVLYYSWNLSQSRLGSLRVCALSGQLEVQRGALSCRSIPLLYGLKSHSTVKS